MRRKQFQWTLPPQIERRLGEATYGRQRTMHEADHLLIILHAPPAPDETTRDPQVFLRKPDGTMMWNGKDGGEPKLRRLLARYRELYEQYDDALDQAGSAAALFEIIEAITPLNRATTHLHQALQSAREAVRDDAFLIAVRDEAYEISRSFELLLADAKNAMDCRIARDNEIQAAKAADMTAAQHKLNILAAMTFPLMALATLLGMNLVHGLEKRTPLLFWCVFAAGLVLGLLTKAWVTRNDARR